MLAEMRALLDDLAPAPSEPVHTKVDLVAVDTVRLPDRVRLVAARDLPRRTWGTPAGRVVTLHALAHIEANAVNLALDAVHRFGDLPVAYYDDWTRVAAEELSHFEALSARLADHGAAYGDLPGHDRLWEAAVTTATDVVARMALVPLVAEARGLDVTPGLIERFERHGDRHSAAVLRVVLADEVGHVEVGVRWFRWACARRGLDPRAEFERLVAEADVRLVPPFNDDARVRAGFHPDDLRRWTDAFVPRHASGAT